MSTTAMSGSGKLPTELGRDGEPACLRALLEAAAPVVRDHRERRQAARREASRRAPTTSPDEQLHEWVRGVAEERRSARCRARAAGCRASAGPSFASSTSTRSEAPSPSAADARDRAAQRRGHRLAVDQELQLGRERGLLRHRAVHLAGVGIAERQRGNHQPVADRDPARDVDQPLRIAMGRHSARRRTRGGDRRQRLALADQVGLV